MNYLKMNRIQKDLAQHEFHTDMLALQMADDESYERYMPLEAYYDTALYHAEQDEDYDECQLVVDTARRYKIELSYYDPE